MEKGPSASANVAVFSMSSGALFLLSALLLPGFASRRGRSSRRLEDPPAVAGVASSLEDPPRVLPLPSLQVRRPWGVYSVKGSSICGVALSVNGFSVCGAFVPVKGSSIPAGAFAPIGRGVGALFVDLLQFFLF